MGTDDRESSYNLKQSKAAAFQPDEDSQPLLMGWSECSRWTTQECFTNPLRQEIFPWCAYSITIILSFDGWMHIHSHWRITNLLCQDIAWGKSCTVCIYFLCVFFFKNIFNKNVFGKCLLVYLSFPSRLGCVFPLVFIICRRIWIFI